MKKIEGEVQGITSSDRPFEEKLTILSHGYGEKYT